MNESRLQLRLDPWPPEYDSATQLETPDTGDAAGVDPAVETTDWKPIAPRRGPLEEPLFFVDGVRRVEARVLAEQDNQLIHGLFGSMAVGSVTLEPGHASSDPARRIGARFTQLQVARFLILGKGRQPDPQRLAVGHSEILFQPFSVIENSPAAGLATLQNLMRAAEARLAEELNDFCVFVDGPLNYFSLAAAGAVGIVKRLYLPYLSAHHFALVPQLSVSERSPLFAVQGGRQDRYSWFLRVAVPGPIDHSLAGIVRLEVQASVGLDRAVQMADQSTVCLPGLASDRIREPRAPQNLVPVGALEFELRRRLGDPVLIRRCIEESLHGGLAA